MFDNDAVEKFQVHQYLPPSVVEQIKLKEGWVHLITQVSTCAGNLAEYFINGEVIKEDTEMEFQIKLITHPNPVAVNAEDIEELESRLQTGL